MALKVSAFRKEKVHGSGKMDFKGWLITSVTGSAGNQVNFTVADDEFKALLKAMKKAYRRSKRF
jgi:hypothetical protein